MNPWSSQQTDDIEKLFSLFGIEPIGTVEGILPEVPPFISRGVVVATGTTGPSPGPSGTANPSTS